MIPVKINTWGSFIDTDGKKGRLIINPKPNTFHFWLYMYYDGEPYPFDEWLEKVGFIEFALIERFTNVIWENTDTDEIINMPYFMPDKSGKIAGSGKYENCQIIFYQVFTSISDEENYNIPENTPAWLIDISSNCGNIKHSEFIIQPSTVAYFFELYDIKIDYPIYFDLKSIDGILSAIAYWKNYVLTYIPAQKELTILVDALAQKLSSNSIVLDAKIIKNILAAWHTQPESERKSLNIAHYEKLLAQYLVIEPLQNKIATLKTLSQSRPLLAREQYERDTLQKILTIASLNDISILAEEISRQAIDPELKKRLLSIAEEKKRILDI